MRVFFFITKSEQGGAQTHVAQLMRSLTAHGHEVAVMSAPGKWLEHETTRLGARFFSNPALANTANPIRLLTSARVLLNAVNVFKPDLVACHSTMAGLMGRLTLLGRVPTIFTAHGWEFTQGASRLRRWILPLFERLAGRYAKKIICVSRNDLELARAHHIVPDEKLALVYNGVEPAQAEACGYHDDRVDIFFVGRLAAPKNPGLLVKAFSQLPRELQHKAHVTIIGDGPDRARLEALINRLQLSHHVELTGALTRQNVLERLNTQADIFTLISRWEGFPYSILEAMAAGIPVIASRAGGIPEALEQAGGILIDNDSLKQLTLALTRLITDKELREKMGGLAQETVTSKFSVEQMCEKTFAEYRLALLQ